MADLPALKAQFIVEVLRTRPKLSIDEVVEAAKQLYTYTLAKDDTDGRHDG